MLPAHWLTARSLEMFSTTFGDIALTYTPAAVEGFFFGLMLPTGSDVFARVGQLPFFLVALSLLMEMAARGRTGTARNLAIVAPMVFVCWPLLLIQASGSMVDVAAATYFLAALLAIFRWKDTGRVHELIFAGALTGLFLGSRFTGVVFAPLLFVAVAPGLGRDGWKWLRFLIPLALMGAYPYLRNLWATGNPLYPVSLAVAGWELPGLFTRDATLAMPAHVSFGDFLMRSWYQLRWIGPAWLILALAAPRLSRDPITKWCAGLGCALIVLHCVAVPYNSNVRFLYPAWGMFVVAAVRGLSVSRSGRICLVVFGVASLVSFFGWGLPEGLLLFLELDRSWLAGFGAVTLVAGAILGAWFSQLGGHKSTVFAVAITVAFVTVAGVLHEQRVQRSSDGALEKLGLPGTRSLLGQAHDGTEGEPRVLRAQSSLPSHWR